MESLTKWIMACAVLALPLAANAQLNSNTTNVSLSATLNESLLITLNSGATQSITSLTPAAVNSFSGGPANVTTSWVFKPGRTAVALYAYFDSPTTAMLHTDTQNTADIPAAAIKAQLNGAGAYNGLGNSLVSTFGGTATGLQLFSQSITGTTKNSNRTDTIALELDLSGPAYGQDMTQLPARHLHWNDTHPGAGHSGNSMTTLNHKSKGNRSSPFRFLLCPDRTRRDRLHGIKAKPAKSLMDLCSRAG